jgi:hypothetical protein
MPRGPTTAVTDEELPPVGPPTNAHEAVDFTGTGLEGAAASPDATEHPDTAAAVSSAATVQQTSVGNYVFLKMVGMQQ